MYDAGDKAALKAECKEQKKAKKLAVRDDKKTRVEEAAKARRGKRRQLIDKAKFVCEQLGINSYSKSGFEIYQIAFKMADNKSIGIMIAILQSHPRLAQAREENRPPPEPVHRKEDFIVNESAALVRSKNKAGWDALRQGITDSSSKGLTFGINLQSPKDKPLGRQLASVPVLEVVDPDVVLARTATRKKIYIPANRDASMRTAAMPSGLLVASKIKVKPTTPVEGLADVIRELIPAGLIPDFRRFVFEQRHSGLPANQLADRFLTENESIPSVTEQSSLSVTDVKPATVTDVNLAPRNSTMVNSIAQHVDMTDYTSFATNEGVFVQSQRNTAAQKAFRDAVMANCFGRCLVSGKSYQRALQACHIQPHAQYGKMHVCNGLLLETSLHDVFDAGDMAIHPATLRVYFSRAALDGGFNEYHGKVIGKTQVVLGTEELVARWESFAAIHDIIKEPN